MYRYCTRHPCLVWCPDLWYEHDLQKGRGPGLALLAESFAECRWPSPQGRSICYSDFIPMGCPGAIHSDPLDVGLFVDILNEVMRVQEMLKL